MESSCAKGNLITYCEYRDKDFAIHTSRAMATRDFIGYEVIGSTTSVNNTLHTRTLHLRTTTQTRHLSASSTTSPTLDAFWCSCKGQLLSPEAGSVCLSLIQIGRTLIRLRQPLARLDQRSSCASSLDIPYHGSLAPLRTQPIRVQPSSLV